MIHSTYSSRLRYPIGTRFTSKQSRTIGAYTNRKELTVGRDIVYNDPWTKYVVFETYGPVELKHVFLGIEKSEMHPLYTRVLSSDSSQYSRAAVVLYRQSIEAFLKRTKNTNTELKSIGDVVLDQVIDSVSNYDMWTATDIIKDFKNEEYNNNLVNNGAVLLPATLTSVIDEDQVKYPISDYVYKTMAVENNIEQARKWADHIVSYLCDFTQVPADAFYYESAHPLWNELESIFNPNMGSAYEPIKFDPITRTNLNEVVVDRSKLVSASMSGRPSSFRFPISIEESVDTVYPNIFSSNLLLWIAALHHLPFRELFFSYILPTRNTPFSFKNVRGSTLGNVPVQQLLMELVDISLFWKESITQVDVLLTAGDELWMTLYEQDRKETMFIDMTIPILLSQKFYS